MGESFIRRRLNTTARERGEPVLDQSQAESKEPGNDQHGVPLLEATACIAERKRQSNLASAYRAAKRAVVRAGFSEEIAWQESVRFDDLTESDLLREHAWVTLSAGMHDYVVRRIFNAISESFFDWKSADMIVANESACRRLALQRFNNFRKIDAIIQAATIVNRIGFYEYKRSVRVNPIEVLKSLPFVGPVTCYHLAKNIGLPFAKPDRHLVRLAESMGYSDVQAFCESISQLTGDSVPVVDIVLWRFATFHTGYVLLLKGIEYRGRPLYL